MNYNKTFLYTTCNKINHSIDTSVHVWIHTLLYSVHTVLSWRNSIWNWLPPMFLFILRFILNDKMLKFPLSTFRAVSKCWPTGGCDKSKELNNWILIDRRRDSWFTHLLCCYLFTWLNLLPAKRCGLYRKAAMDALWTNDIVGPFYASFFLNYFFRDVMLLVEVEYRFGPTPWHCAW